MKAITTFLGFEANAEEAVTTYVELFNNVFGNSEVQRVIRFDEAEIDALSQIPEMQDNGMPGPPGMPKVIHFTLNGEELVAFNGGDYFGKFHESVSLYVTCETQDQIDRLWATLSVDGQEQPCGWVKDRYGISWQIAPRLVWDIDAGDDRGKAEKMNIALFHMRKIDVGALERALA